MDNLLELLRHHKVEINEDMEDMFERCELEDLDIDVESVFDDLMDDVHELADSMVDIYTHDLLKWAPDNYEWIEDAIDEGFVDLTSPAGQATSPFINMIMAGQYLYYSNLYAQDLHSAKLELIDAIKEAS